VAIRRFIRRFVTVNIRFMMYTAPLKAFLAKTAELKDKVGSNIIINISLGHAGCRV
jgi:hypothetical protein